MFDIHTHILPNIDDGSSSIEDSIQMVLDLKEQGINSIILTPHFDIYQNRCNHNTNYIEEFNNFKKEIKKRNIDINLYLGNEIFYTPKVYKYLKEKKVFPLGNTNKVLIEFSFIDEIKNIEDIIYEFKIEGYEVIIAHVERYDYASYKLIKSWKEQGALIQVNASSFYETRKPKRLVRKLLKNKLIDYIASDIHSFRKSYISQFIKDYKDTSYFNFE